MWPDVQVWWQYNSTPQCCPQVCTPANIKDLYSFDPPAQPRPQQPSPLHQPPDFLSKLNKTRVRLTSSMSGKIQSLTGLPRHLSPQFSTVQHLSLSLNLWSIRLGECGVTVKFICLRKEWCIHTAVKYGVQNKYCIENSNQIQSLDLHF